MNDLSNLSAIAFELCKIQAIAKCLDDAITGAVEFNPSEAGERAVCLVDLLREHLDKLVADVDHSGEGAA